MADLDISGVLYYPDKRAGRGNTTTTNVNTEFANFASVQSMRARLTALAVGTYPAGGTRLAGMTKNDMMWALRQISDSAGI